MARLLFISYLLAATFAAVGVSSSSSPSPASQLFLEESLMGLFTSGETVLTMAHPEEETGGDSGASPPHPSTTVLGTQTNRSGWYRWWLDQYESAAVIYKAKSSGAINPTNAPNGAPAPFSSSIAAAFTMADFDRLLVTTGGIDSMFDEVNRQMRRDWCVAPSSSPSVCPRDCHPVSEVDELAKLSRHFKDTFERSQTTVFGGAKDEEKDLGRTIAGAFKLPLEDEASKAASSSSSSVLSLLSSQHFIESIRLFATYYYQQEEEEDHKGNDDSSSSASTSSSPLNGPNAAVTHSMMIQQRFINMTSIVKECRGRSARFRKANRQQHSDAAAAGAATMDSNPPTASRRQYVLSLIDQIAAASAGGNALGVGKGTGGSPHQQPNNHRLISLAAQLPHGFKEQYVCLLRFYSDQPSFLPIVGALRDAELWLLNIGQQRIEGLEKTVIGVPYGGARQSVADKKQLSSGVGGSNAVYTVPSLDEYLQQKRALSSGGANNINNNAVNIPQLLHNQHVVGQHMSPLRQLAHRTGKTLIVRDADGRSALVRHAQLLVKQRLFGLEASGVDMGASLVYEPAPRLTEESIYGRHAHSLLDGGDDDGATQKKNATSLAQVRFSSQPPRFEIYDTILIRLNDAAPANDKFVSDEAVSDNQKTMNAHRVAPTGSRLLVALQRSGTHLHNTLKPCGGAKNTADDLNAVGGKVEKEFYVSETASLLKNLRSSGSGNANAQQKKKASAALPLSSVVPLEEAMCAMPAVSRSCLRERVDYYSHPMLDTKAVAELRRAQRRAALRALAGPENVATDDEADADDDDGEDNHNGNSDDGHLPTPYAHLLNASIYPSTQRVFLDKAGDMLYIPRGMIYSTRTLRHVGGAGDESSPSSPSASTSSVVSLDGALFLSLTIAPITANHDAATLGALLQSTVREAYHTFGQQKAEGGGEEAPPTKGAAAATKYCQNDINTVADRPLYQRSNVVVPAAIVDEENRKKEGDGEQLPFVNPFRGNTIVAKDMGIFQQEQPKEDPTAAGASPSTADAATDAPSSGDAGFMRIGRRKKKGAAALSASSSASPPTAALPFPSECFNEAHFAIVLVEALQVVIPSLRRSIVRVPSIGGGPAASDDGDDASSSLGPQAFANALYQRHMGLLRTAKKAIRDHIIGGGGEGEGGDDPSLPSSSSDHSSSSASAVDPAVAHKRWTKLVLGKVLVEHALFESTPLWFHESTPFRERMVVAGSSSSGVGGGSSSVPPPSSSSFFTRQCTMRAGDIVKLLASVGPVPVEELNLAERRDIIGGDADGIQRKAKAASRTASSAFAHFKGQAVVTWKQSHALEVTSTAMRTLVVERMLLGDAFGTLLGTTTVSSSKNDGNVDVDDSGDSTQVNTNRRPPHLVPRPWLATIARHKHKYRQGTGYWLHFNTMMLASSNADVEALEDVFFQ